MKRKTRLKYKPTRHHIIPQSRGGRSLEGNITMVPQKLHRDYHTLFENRTPEEIGEYLNRRFWNGSYYVEVRRR